MFCIHKDPENGWCKLHSDWSSPMPVIEYCVEGPCPDERFPTNADRIRGMDDEELADSRVGELIGISPCPLWIAIDVPDKLVLSKEKAVRMELAWLQQPAKEGTE